MKNLIKSFSILIISFANTLIFSQEIPDVSQDITLRNNFGESQILSFGLDHLATDDIDFILGELELPPPPPTEVWDMRQWLPPFNGVISAWKDYRGETNFPYTGQREHRLAFQIGEHTDTLYIEWNFPPEITGVLTDLITGTLVNVPMQGIGSFAMVRGVMPDPLLLDKIKMTINYNNVVADVNESLSDVPTNYILEQNYPNPFNPSTKINFSLPTDSEIKLKIFDVLGNEVANPVSGYYLAGNYSVEFNAKGLASGIYIYQLNYNGKIISKKMTLLK
ncbi:MAG: T9SS type A sorting domain-containing protein [Ignavibacteriaceae bacterium]|nr:T9SS type A sorting domain-containing protein [Ignavibacteriaceae bacterium]